MAEAAVLIRPDTTKFRALLEAELAAATKGVVVPVTVVAAGGKQASAALVASTESATAANIALSESSQLAGGSARAQAEAERLAALAQTAVATTADAGALATTKLAAAKAVLNATNRAVATSEDAVAAALATEDAALQATTAETLRVAVAQQEVAASTALATAALARNAGAAAADAVSHEQLARGGVATAGSLLGVRGATLAASKNFLIGATAVVLFAKSVKEASDEQEALSRVVKILGPDLGKQSEEWARNEAAQGLSTAAALKYQGALAQVLSVSGFTREKTAQLSQSLVQLGADIAARAHLATDLGLRALQLGISGNLRGLRAFGITLTAAEVKTEALRLSGKKLAADLSREELAQARINLIRKDAANALGAAAERSGELSQASLILKANLSNLGASIGELSSPILTELVVDLNFVLKGLNKLPDAVGAVKAKFDELPEPVKKAGSVMKEFGIAIIPFVGPTIEAIRLLRRVTDDSADSANKAAGAFSAFGRVLGLVQGAIANLSDALAKPDSLEQQLLKAELAGNVTKQLAILAQQQKAAAKNAANSFPGSKDETKFLQKEKAAQNQANGIRAQIAADAKSAAAAAQAAADKALADAKALRDKQDQAVQTALGFAQARHARKLVFIEATKQVKDDLRESLRYRAELRKFLREQIPLIHDLVLRAQVTLDIKTAIDQETAAENAFRNTIADNAAAKKKAAHDRRVKQRDEILAAQQFQVDLANVQGRTNDEIRALEKLIGLENRRLKLLNKQSQAYRDLRLKIAQDTKDLNDLKKAQQKKNDAAASLQFEFLQAQQGFAATILSNLLPASAIGGSVGGSTGGAGGRLPITDFTGGREDPTRGLGAAAGLAQAKDRGPTQGQQTIVIGILRQILHVLAGQRLGSQHPEARHQRSAGSAAMDIM